MTTATTPSTIGHHVNGRAVAGASVRQQDVFNPATGAVTARVALANAADVNAAVVAATAAFPAW
jgi:malonate-semialdehyde dehydrogenase (acetylating)/methylmalonate-semialdehyde dehydrogenase